MTVGLPDYLANLSEETTMVLSGTGQKDLELQICLMLSSLKRGRRAM